MGDPCDWFFEPSIIMGRHLRNLDSSWTLGARPDAQKGTESDSQVGRRDPTLFSFLLRSDQRPNRVCRPRISYGAVAASGTESVLDTR